MPHKSFVIRRSMSYFSSSFCLSCFLWDDFIRRNWSFKANTEHQWKPSAAWETKSQSGCFWMFFIIVWWQGWIITSTFQALGITKSLSFHSIWYALTLMLELIISPVQYHFNTFIRIYWNFTNAVRWAYRLLDLCTTVILYPQSGSGKSTTITWLLVSYDGWAYQDISRIWAFRTQQDTKWNNVFWFCYIGSSLFLFYFKTRFYYTAILKLMSSFQKLSIEQIETHEIKEIINGDTNNNKYLGWLNIIILTD